MMFLARSAMPSIFCMILSQLHVVTHDDVARLLGVTKMKHEKCQPVLRKDSFPFRKADCKNFFRNQVIAFSQQA